MRDTSKILEQQNVFYETIREELETGSFGKWAVVSNEKLVGVYDSNREASEVVLELAPKQVCIVKHIGHAMNLSHPMVRVNHVPVRHP